MRNIQDNSDFWHSVVAKSGSDLIVGKNAFNMVSLLGIQLDRARDLQPNYFFKN